MLTSGPKVGLFAVVLFNKAESRPIDASSESSRGTQSYPELFRITQELPRVTQSRPKVNNMNENKANRANDASSAVCGKQ